jgi:uncharacterized protein YegL
MKTRIFNLVIMDESGSMYTICKQAIDSVNETIQTIRAAQKKHEDQEHYLTLVTFNNEMKTLYDCTPIDEVGDFKYMPDCCTALYDAMGHSITTLRKKVAEADKVLVTVVTDGYENASKEYTGKAIKALVDELKTKGWVFAYMGANHDVEAAAATISITNAISFEASDAGVVEMSTGVCYSRSAWYDDIASGKEDSEEANKSFFNKWFNK